MGWYIAKDPLKNDISPSGEKPEQRKLAPTLYNQLTVAKQYFTNITAIQNMGVV